jgi:putative FmdB family regulatory protein
VPTYQYACKDCGHAFEQVQGFSDDALTVCPECDGRLRKVFNAVGVVFKGSGFYRNDSRTSGTPTAGSSSESSSESSTGSTSEKSPVPEKKSESASTTTTSTKPDTSTSGSTSAA